MDRHDDVEVAIVGGGVSGLYAGWRLAGAEGFRPKKIAILEAGERIGGRLRSATFAAADDLVAELGGIAFHRTHYHVHRLVDQLGLPKAQHPIGSRRSLLNLRGRSLAYRRIRYQLARPFSFRLARRTQIQGVAALLRAASERVLPGSASFAPDDWMRAASESTFMGKPLRDWPLRLALSRVLESEEVRFVEAASGFSLFTRAPNAATGLAWNMEELSVGGDLTRLVAGYQSLPLTLAEQTNEHGVSVHLRHRLIAIDRASDSFTLRFEANGGEACRAISARSVILALPRKALEAVSGIVELVGNRILTTVTPWPMCTIALLYPSAWWARIGIERGRSVTDLPARQLWQFGRSEERPGLIVSHSDGDDAAFWQAMRPSGNDAEGFSSIAPESEIMQELHRQICSVYSPAVRGRSRRRRRVVSRTGAPRPMAARCMCGRAASTRRRLSTLPCNRHLACRCLFAARPGRRSKAGSKAPWIRPRRCCKSISAFGHRRGCDECPEACLMDERRIVFRIFCLPLLKGARA